MAAAGYKFNQLSHMLANQEIDWLNDTHKVALLTNSATVVATNSLFSELSTNEISDINYTAGGATVAGKTLDSVGDDAFARASNVAWSALTVTVKYAVLYDSTTGKVLLWHDLDDGGAGLALSAQPLTLVLADNYLFSLI